jgi:hypothetical protein
MKNKVIAYIAETEVIQESGMGRIAWHWKKECERRGHEFIEITPKNI